MPVALSSKMRVCSRLIAGIAAPNSAGDTGVRLLCVV